MIEIDRFGHNGKAIDRFPEIELVNVLDLKGYVDTELRLNYTDF